MGASSVAWMPLVVTTLEAAVMVGIGALEVVGELVFVVVLDEPPQALTPRESRTIAQRSASRSVRLMALLIIRRD